MRTRQGQGQIDHQPGSGIGGETERRLILLRFFEQRAQSEFGNELGISPM
jgi:hypothetical protein